MSLLDALFKNPYMTVARAAVFLGVSNPTARRTVADLHSVALLKEVSGRKWGQIYQAAPIMNAIEKAAR